MSQKSIEIAAICQALVDVIYEDDGTLAAQLGVSIDSHRHIDARTSADIQRQFKLYAPQILPGGSALNTLRACRALGGTAHAFFRTGKDALGATFAEEAVRDGLVITQHHDTERPTGHSLIITNPPSSRAMLTCLAAAERFAKQEIPAGWCSTAEIFLIEGYMLAIAGDDYLAFIEELARTRPNLTICLTFSAPFIASLHREKLIRALRCSTMAVANRLEAASFTGTANAEQNASEILSFLRASNAQPIAAVTAGVDGSFVASSKSGSVHVPAFHVNTVDVTGAGDAFTAGFLWALHHQVSLADAATTGAALAAAVVAKVGARVDQHVVAESKKILASNKPLEITARDDSATKKRS